MPVQSGMTTVFQKWNFMNKRMSEKGLIILYSLIFVIAQWFLNVLQTTPVSYTHLTLPTISRVEVSGGGG